MRPRTGRGLLVAILLAMLLYVGGIVIILLAVIYDD